MPLAESNGPTFRIYYSDGREKYMLMQTCREDSGHPFISLGDYYESNVLGSAGDTVLVKKGVSDLVAIDVRSGRELWRKDMDGPVVSLGNAVYQQGGDIVRYI